MVRPVSGDHVMFQECIQVFRPKPDSYIISDESEKRGYLLLDFDLRKELNFSRFKIEPTHKIKLSESYGSFIAPVVLPDCKDSSNSHLYTIALSSLISFVTSRPAKAPRDSDIEVDYKTLTLLFPSKLYGPNYVNTFLPEEKIQGISSELREIIDMLHAFPYEDYKRFMQSIRLINLAHNNKREDFALAYYLLVSAIEGIAQMAIPLEIKEDPQEKEWEILAKEHKSIKSLLNQFRNFQNNSHQLTKRFINFILQYCPSSEWLRLEHSEEDTIASFESKADFSWITKKKWDEVYPEDFKASDIKKIIGDTYKYRSKYSHEGEAPPHTNPDAFHRFFETENEWDHEKREYTEKHLINYRLLSFIAKNSILEYMRIRYKQLNT
ncbi:hypothetical protein [Peribacillus frigoritolerans]|uniref:hypothetical protein n=1 Tax=Peribacillus frigoritolerans TaxID=450367 RepID=UPI00164D0161|nr:hypothetical protein [Peribacillus frigoritolerans]MED3835100.1 hypothetical protein [Peribacillus frigoritolerans]MED3845791.1 hypothetical protein [Peribacillus frigoritolerans]QNK49389.1 hypothetical protein H7F28_03515 [Brevibacterium sp. PAMC23299]WHY13873.1 hypothetical protein QNH16_24675 [Peribacillus frigoritolerans]